MAVHILGIRHHGVGSAIKVQERLQELDVDFIFIEGPPEITEAIQVIGHEELIPPAAIMIYDEKNPLISSFYPFAEFSPEYVAAKFAKKRNIPLQAMDLPAATSYRIQELARARKAKLNEDAEQEIDENPIKEVIGDPMDVLAQIEGFKDGEAFWEYHFEQSNDSSASEHFEAVMLVMKSLRDSGQKSHLEEENIVREAYMRKMISEKQNEMFQNIVVICGAWHAPALIDLDAHAKTDVKILKKLPKSKAKIAASWIPWTNSRLSYFSGYGAGLLSPGWYEHQWWNREDIEISWLTKIAEAFRKKDVDISSAHVMETYRLSHALTSLRNKSKISLDELNESISTVMCMGDNILFELIKSEIVVGQKIGSLPEDLPKVPLQKDFETQCKSLRLKISEESKNYNLDLRKPIDLRRSIFFHRLSLLNIHWAKPAFASSKGTFKEGWILEWNPEMMIAIVDKAFYGNTIEKACEGYIKESCKKDSRIAELMKLLSACIPAELFTSIDDLLVKISNESAVTSDTKDLLNAIPGLVDIIKYGNVRKSDVSQLEAITYRLLNKIFISLPNACYGLDEESSNELFNQISTLHTAIKILEDSSLEECWYATAQEVLSIQGVHHVILGCMVRLLLDNGQYSPEEATRIISYYLTPKQKPEDVAFWVEGFLRGSGLILVYDSRIWNLLYRWVDDLSKETFMELLPTLRRAFSKFQYAERRQIGEKARKGLSANEQLDEGNDDFFNEKSAESMAHALFTFLG